MPNYTVTATHEKTYHYFVDADSPEEAVRKFKSGDTDYGDADLADEGEYFDIECLGLTEDSDY